MTFARPFERPWSMLLLCLLVFYGPMLLAAGTVLTGTDSDLIGHLLYSLGDERPGGRFFHYFDLAVNTRLWGNDVKFSSLHLLRGINMAFGSTTVGWAVLVVGLHSVLFLTLAHYARAVLRVSTPAALSGATVAFFATAWHEWTLQVYWTTGAILLIVSVCEYWLYLTTARRRHLVVCAVANILQPYLIQSVTFIPAQACLLGAVLLMAIHRKGARRATIMPLLRAVWPLSLLGWTPILAPMLFAIGSGLVSRVTLQPMAWGLNVSRVTQALGLLCPVPAAVPALFDKLGWSDIAFPPQGALFSSFLFLPSLLALWRVGRRGVRMLVVGVVLYGLSFFADELIMTPSAFLWSLGFRRSFALPALAGFVVAAAMNLRTPDGSETQGTRWLHRLYWVLLGSAAIGFVALLLVSERRLTDLGVRLGVIGSGTVLPSLLSGARVFCAGIALGLASYLYLTVKRVWPLARWRASAMGSAALFVAIVAPAVGTGYGKMWYQRHPLVERMLSSHAEFTFLRERMPSYEYRVGFVLASEALLARGDWAGFWKWRNQGNEPMLSQLREHDFQSREGLAFALPYLHFEAPVHQALRMAGNPFLQRWDRREARVLNRRNVIVRPEAEAFEDYGVRFWLSDLDLHQLDSKFVPVYHGPHATVFENPRAKPVVFFHEEPAAALPLEHVPFGVRVALSTRRQGTLSVHCDLRNMDAWAVGHDGRRVPLTLQPAGLRWVVEVPPQSAAVVFSAREAGALRVFTASAGVTGLLLVALIGLGRI